MDKVYMTFIQATQGGGGWPMSVFLTPELEPFMGGTYFPPTDQFGRPGFPTILKAISEQVHVLRVFSSECTVPVAMALHFLSQQLRLSLSMCVLACAASYYVLCMDNVWVFWAMDHVLYMCPVLCVHDPFVAMTTLSTQIGRAHV